MIGVDDSGQIYFVWEVSCQSEDYYPEPGESLEDTWNRMIQDLRDLS